MARKNAEATPDILDESYIEKLRQQARAAAENLQERSDDVVGYWLPEVLPIVCRPKNAKLFDSSIDQTKPSILIQVEAVEPTLVVNSDGDRFLAQKGQLVGIWYKPGMRAIRETAGAVTFIELTGEKDTGKGNAMKVFTVRADGGSLLPISSDSRVKSAGAPTPFDVKRVAASTRPAPAPRGPDSNEGFAGDVDDLPF